MSHYRPYMNGSRNNNNQFYAEQTQHLFEQQNDELTSQLNDRVMKLKQLSIDIGDEVKQHNNILENMGFDMETASGIFKTTLTKLDSMIKAGGSNHMCYLSIFIFVIFIIVYFMLKTT